MRRRCDTCGQTETLIRPVNGRDPYWLHLDNEQPHCEGRQEAPADSYSAGASSCTSSSYQPPTEGQR